MTRAEQGLSRLRAQLDQEIPRRTLDQTLILATWNIREFDSPAYGDRLPEALDYIAEIASRFDLVAIQEVRERLDALDKVLQRLGPWWKYVCTDVTEGRPGNGERMAFLFDGRKVRFAGISGEVVIPAVERRDKGKSVVYQPARQLFRTPHVCGFKSGRERFMLCTVHVAYGKGKANDPQREEEIGLVADFLARRASDENAWTNNLVLLGDFNVFSPQDRTLQALGRAGFVVPESLQSLPSNAGRNRYYDQIAFFEHGTIQPTSPTPDVSPRNQEPGTRNLEPALRSGAFDFYQSVFRNDQRAAYAGAMGEAYQKNSKGAPRPEAGKDQYFRTYWRTHQMSDHLPMWVEVQAGDNVAGGT